jgi:glycosyltransferase involved in cell wall biosynthesis
MSKILSILICSLAERHVMLSQLLEILRGQATPDMEIHTFCDNGDTPSGAKRNKLLEWAAGEYVAFVDDDDIVAEDYVASLLAAATTGVDVITFDVAKQVNGKTVEVQSFGLWNQDENGRSPTPHMQANHLCAWKRSIARMVRFPDWLGYGDDQFWYVPLVAARIAKTEYHIPKTLYFYRWSRELSRNQTKEARRTSFDWCGRGIGAWWHDGKIVMGLRSGDENPVMVYDCNGRRYSIDRDEMESITTVRVR